MTPEEIKSALEGFSGGSDTSTRWSPLFRNSVLTNGVKFLADKCSCYWLMDVIGSYQHTTKVKREAFQEWKLVRKPTTSKHEYSDGWVVSMEDGNGNEILRQEIEYSDFPLDDGIRLWAVRNELGGVTIMLPSEY